MSRERKIIIYVAVALIALSVILVIAGAVSRIYFLIAPGVLILLLLGFWIPRCVVQVGSERAQTQAVLVRFGKPKEVLQPGLHWILWPADKLVVYPDKQYKMAFEVEKVYSAESDEAGKKLNTKVMFVSVTVYFFWPTGDDLLRAFRRTPTPTGDMMEDTEMYVVFFESAVDDAVRAVFGRHDDEAIRAMRKDKQKKGEIEQEIKEFLFEEEGNPFREAAIKREAMDLAVTSVKFTDEVEHALSAEEVGRREGAGMGEKLKKQADGTKELLKALIDQGVPPVFAPVFLQQGQGKGMDSQQLMQIAIAMRMMGMDWQTKPTSDRIIKLREELRKRGMQEDEIIVLLQQVGVI